MMAVEGIRQDRYGLRAYVKIGTTQKEKRFPAGTSNKTIQAWRDEARVALRKLQPIHGDVPTLAEDVATYLAQVKSMPTYEQRKRHLELWIAALGADTIRRTITPADIRTVLQTWRAEHGPATCNKRRSALMHLFSVLDGKGASNPVRDVPKFREPQPLPRGRDPHVLDALLRKAPRCRSRACCRVILWTGMRPVELDRAQPEDVNLEHRTAIIRTAKGGRVRVVPLTPQAVSAWKEFAALRCWQDVPQAAPLNRWLKDVTGIKDLRVYDLRHSYGTALARRETRLDVIGSLMGHSTLELTKRYTLAALTPDALEATAKLGRAAGRTAGSREKSKKSA